MGNPNFIQKQLVASEPFQKYSTKEWVLNIWNEDSDKPDKVGTVYGKTKQECESAAMIFVKAWSILQTVDNILTGKDSE